MATIKLLDATLRDGGQGLENLHDVGCADKCFTEAMKQQMTAHLGAAGIDIIELGAMGPSGDDRSRFAIYQDVESLSRNMPRQQDPGSMYVGLYIGPDTDTERIPDWNPELVRGVRVILRYSELRKSLDYCAALSRKGYAVFVQPMLTMRYRDDELDMVLGMANDMNAYACYFVDSYGYMEPGDVERLFEYYDRRLNDGIGIGFHAHNNMNMAYANAMTFLGIDTDRELLVDACATGIGRGGGNLPTELIVPYLNRNHGKDYDYDHVLDVCDILEQEFSASTLWGYSPQRLLPAVYKAAYKYAQVMGTRYNMSLRQMNRVFRDMPEDMRQRYTDDNMRQMLDKTL